MMHTGSATRILPCLGAACFLAILGGCSSPTELAASPAANTDAGADTGDSPAAPDASDASVDMVILPESSPVDGTSFDACATESIPVELLPLDLIVMLDQSGSMTGAKWQSVTSALSGFVAANASPDLGMGLQYFPLPGADVCDYQAYMSPEVPIAPLDQNASAITGSLAAHTPDGETPTLPALQGAFAYAQAWIAAHPDHTAVVVLATDGEPNVCASTITNVSQAASVAYNNPPHVRTFVIGVGKSLTSLDEVAVAGGSDHAFLVDDASQSTQQQFLAALTEIRGTALPCELPIPQPEGGTIDYNRVNVIYSSGADEDILPRVADAAACVQTPSGWYYDDTGGARRVVLCPQACESVRSDTQGRVDLVFGCTTIVA